MFSGASEIMEIVLILFNIIDFLDFFFFILRFKAAKILHIKQGFSERGCPLI